MQRETSNQEYLTLTSFLVQVIQNLQLFFKITLGTSLFGILYIYLIATPIYKSEAKIMSSSSTGNDISQFQGFANQLGFAMPGFGNEKKWAYTEIVKSRKFAKNILNKSFKINNSIKKETLLNIIVDSDESIADSLRLVSGIEAYMDMVKIQENLKNKVFKIEVFSKERDLSAKINQSIINELDSYMKKFNKDKTSEARIFIEDRIKETYLDLEQLENKLKDFLDRNRRIDNSPTLQLQKERLTREVNVINGVYTTLKQQLESTKIEEVKDSDYIIIVDPPNFPHKPFSPKKMYLLAISFVIGLFISSIIIALSLFYKGLSKEELKNYNVIYSELKTKKTQLLSFIKKK